jgi:hypothetical protein
VFVYGPLTDLPRKNCWTIAEHAGNSSPDGIQHPLSRAVAPKCVGSSTVPVRVSWTAVLRDKRGVDG